MKKLLILIAVILCFSACDFINPASDNKDFDSHIRVNSGLSGDTIAPVPGNNGFLVINQRPGIAVIDIPKAADNDTSQSEIRYRGGISNFEIDTPSKFSYRWNKNEINGFFSFWGENGVTPYDYVLMDFGAGLRYEMHYDSTVESSFNVQVSDNNGNMAVYNEYYCADVPLFGDFLPMGSDADDSPDLNNLNYSAPGTLSATDSEGNIYMALHYRNAFTLPDGNSVSFLGDTDIILVKFSPGFVIIWYAVIQSAGDDQIHDIHITEQDEILLSVSFQAAYGEALNIVYPGDIVYPGGTDNSILHSNGNVHDGAVIELGRGGNLLQVYHFMKYISGGEAGRVLIKKVIEDKEGFRYIMGTTMNNVEKILPAAGDAFLIEDVDGETPTFLTGRWFDFVIREDNEHNIIDFAAFGFGEGTGHPADPEPTTMIDDAVITNDNRLIIAGWYTDIFNMYDKVNGDFPEIILPSTGLPQYYVLEFDIHDLSFPVAAMAISGAFAGSRIILEKSEFDGIFLAGSATGQTEPSGNGWGENYNFGVDTGIFIYRFFSLTDMYPNYYWIWSEHSNFILNDIKTDPFGIMYLGGTVTTSASIENEGMYIGFEHIYSVMPDRIQINKGNAFMAAFNMRSSAVYGRPFVRYLGGNSGLPDPYASGDSLIVMKNYIMLTGLFSGEIHQELGFPDGIPARQETSLGTGNDVYLCKMRIGNLY